jgi:hypothetical protein
VGSVLVYIKYLEYRCPMLTDVSQAQALIYHTTMTTYFKPVTHVRPFDLTRYVFPSCHHLAKAFVNIFCVCDRDNGIAEEAIDLCVGLEGFFKTVSRVGSLPQGIEEYMH